MPRVQRNRSERVPIRIPVTMMDEIDRIVREHPELHYNRQQFVETAIREKIERTRLLEQQSKEKQ